MLSMTNIDVLKDKDEPDSLLTEITLDQARRWNDGIIAGGMILKSVLTDAIRPRQRVVHHHGTVPMPSSSKCSPKKAWARCS